LPVYLTICQKYQWLAKDKINTKHINVMNQTIRREHQYINAIYKVLTTKGNYRSKHK
jgi:hypothetical protein